MFTSKNRRGTRAGFTLIELMIAITVLLVAVLCTFTSQLKSRDLLQTSRETTIAMAELQEAMERILLRPVDTIPIASSAYADGRPIAAYTDRNLSNEQIVPDYPGYTAGGPVPDPLPIVLTITWNDPRGRPRTKTLCSMKTR
ncbi:MAG: prepilin-type N-terminal cleavage/methylation domain-containing protein [Planctomycetota bacterium]|nr:prepilin-type N-terminal cleavage/methylation domain-containing protein [Planctomycetota bacterium]